MPEVEDAYAERVDGDLPLLVDRLTRLIAEMRAPGYCHPHERFAVEGVCSRLEFAMYGGVSGSQPVAPAVVIGPDGTNHQERFEQTKTWLLRP